MAVIEADGLTKRYGRVTVVDRLTFSVEAGQVAGFSGLTGPARPPV